MDRRLIVFFLANALLIFLQALVNHRLAPLSVSVFVPGLMLILAPLYLRPLSGLLCLVLSGLWLDAAMPGLPFGFSMIVFVTLGLFIRHYRNRFQPQQNFHPLLLALLSNALWLLAVGFFAGRGQLLDWIYQLRFWSDFLLSQLVLLAIAVWFFNLQRSALYFLGWKTDPEELPLV